MALAVVETTCGDDGGQSQTNDVVVMAAALAVAAVMTHGDDGATSQTNGVVVTMTLVVAAATYGDDGVIP